MELTFEKHNDGKTVSRGRFKGLATKFTADKQSGREYVYSSLNLEPFEVTFVLEACVGTNKS